MSAPIYNLKGKRVWVAGHNGMVGSALLRRLEPEGCTLITAPHQALDLTRQADVELEMFGAGKPEIIEWRLMKGALTGIGLLRRGAARIWSTRRSSTSRQTRSLPPNPSAGGVGGALELAAGCCGRD